MELLLVAVVAICGVLYIAFRGEGSGHVEDEEGGYEVTRLGPPEEG